MKANKGLSAALASAVFLGLAPVFGKQAILLGLPWQAVVALRTLFAAMLVLILVVIANRRFLYIYPAGLLGCALAGVINGFGSLLYYGALGRIDASMGQLLYSLYPAFVGLWLWLDRQPPGKITTLRLAIALPALVLLSQTNQKNLDVTGALMMLGAAALYALHLPINQRVLRDMPAPTVTLYTLLAMSAVVLPAFLISGQPLFPGLEKGWLPLAGITLVTFASRMTLFLGVKHIGGMQTALLGLGELLVTLVFSRVILHEQLSWQQWMGAGLLMLSLALVVWEKKPPQPRGGGGWLSFLNPTNLTRLPWQGRD